MLEIPQRILDVRERETDWETDSPSYLGIAEGFPRC
jgi:hypothetical protein